MQNTGNQNATGFFPVKDGMLPLLHAPQARTDFITRAAKPRVIAQQLTAILQFAKITVSLLCAPGAERIKANFDQIDLGQT